MELVRQPNESEFDFHKRIIYGKLVDKSLSDIDYSELAPSAFGKEYSSDVARRMFYGSRITLDLLAETENSSDQTVQTPEEEIIELKKIRQKVKDERTALNKTIRQIARCEQLEELIEEAILSGKLNELEVVAPPKQQRQDTKRDLAITLNDIHFGIEVENQWNTYNPEVCKQYFDNYLDQIIDIGHRHGAEDCYVLCNGDMISGDIHYTVAIENRENVIYQIMGVSELISQFVADLSKYFRRVVVCTVPGNHSRIKQKENAPINERLDDLIGWYLKARLQNFKNVTIGHGRIDPTMYLVNIRGLNYLGVHGDFDNTKDAVARLTSMTKKPVYAIVSGHFHRNKIDEVQGVKTVMGGSFIGTDSYAVSKRLLSDPQQLAMVVTKNGIECYYDVRLKENLT